MRGAMLAWTRWVITEWSNNRRFAIWTSSVLAFLIRLGISFALKTYQFGAAEDHFAFGYEWGRIARWLVERHMFSLDGTDLTAGTDPLYILVIAPFFHAFGIFTESAAIALIVLQSLLCGLSTWALFVLAEK